MGYLMTGWIGFILAFLVIQFSGDTIIDKEKMTTGKVFESNKKFYKCKEMNQTFKEK